MTDVGPWLVAGVAIIGLIVNNIVTYKNTGRQLEHDRKKTAQQEARDREKVEATRRLDLRRDTYMGLAQHVYDTFVFLIALADIGLELKDIAVQRRSAQKFAAQVHLMAQPELVEATSLGLAAIDRAALQVRLRRDQVLSEQSKMLQLRKQIDEHRARANEAWKIFRQIGLEGKGTPPDFQRLEKIAKAEEAAAAPLAERHDEILLHQLPRMQYELWTFAVARQHELIPAIHKIIAAARAELGESIDMSIYYRDMDKLREVAEANAESLRQLFGMKPSHQEPTTAS